MQWKINQTTTKSSRNLQLVCKFESETLARCILEAHMCFQYHSHARWTLRDEYAPADAQLFFRVSRDGATVIFSGFNATDTDVTPIINALQDAEERVKMTMMVARAAAKESEKQLGAKLQTLVNRIYDLEQQVSTLEQHLENLWSSYEELHQRMETLEKTWELHRAKPFHFLRS